MKKTLLLLASAALIFAGCAKEKFADNLEGGLQEVTFTASLESGVATKSDIDTDGNGAFVNRCIMEIYFQDQLYKRMVQPSVNKVATFVNVPVVAGKQYQILFWADHVDNLEEYITTDKYYDTQNGLKAVKIIKDSFIDALEDNTNDYLDAFCFSGDYTVPQEGKSFTDIKLTRPFAQLNVITTDVGEGKTVTSADLLPDKVSVSYKADNTINVATGAISKVGEEEDYTFTYEADVFGAWSTVTTDHKELTLSMDYFLASTEQAAVDVTFITKNGGQAVMTHSLANLPYKRNYRTNVKGDLLTAAGTWTATIDPIWNTPDIVKVVEVADIKSANEIINQYASTTANLEVKFVGVPNDSGVPSGSEGSQFRAIRTTPLQEGANLGIEVMTSTNTLYVGDYIYEYKVTGGTVAEYIDNTAKQATVNINVPANSGIGTLIINAPTKTVLVNGHLVESVGTITNIDAITSQNTLIIEPGQQVGTLTMHQGGLEIHGTVTNLIITETDKQNNPVKVRTSENLSQAVFGVIYQAGDGGHDFIDRPDFSERQNADGTWNIVPSVCKITETGKAYGTVADAFKAVENGQTIVMLQNDVLTKGHTITLENNETFTLDLNGKTISIAETGFDFTANGTNAALRDGVPVRFAIVVNGVGTMTICDNSTDKLGRLETKNNSYGTTKTILVDGNAIVNVNGGTIAADYAAFYVVGFTGTTALPVDAPKPTLNVNGGKILGKMVGIGIKGNTAKLKVTGGEIVAQEYTGVSTNGTQDWYDGGKFAIEITGGLIKSVEGAAMYLPAEGPTVITGGTIEGASGIAVKGGSLTISGDAIVKADGPYGEAGAASSGYSDTGSAIYVEDTYAYHAPIVNISGGKFSSVNNKAVEYFTTKADDASDKGKVTLTGGIYSDAPEATLVAAGYAVLDNPDATTKAQYPYTVKVKPVVKIGNVEYADIADAFAAITTSTPTTVTLLENIGSKTGDVINWKEYDRAFAYTVNAGQNITFDLNGHKIYAKTTVNGYTGFLLVKNGGSLTIKDSAEGGEINYFDGKDNEGGLAISSEGNLTMLSGTVENHTHCVNAAIQGAIDVHANEWGTPYAHHVTFNMEGGVLKSQTDNTLRIYDSSQTGTGGVVIDFEINGGEIYGADAVFIMPAWIAGPTHVSNDIHMNNINVSVTGGHFDTTNGIRVFGAVNAPNDKDYKAIDISVTGGEFIVRGSTKYREGHIAYQNNYASTAEAVPNLVSFTKVTWTADAPTYID